MDGDSCCWTRVLAHLYAWSIPPPTTLAERPTVRSLQTRCHGLSIGRNPIFFVKVPGTNHWAKPWGEPDERRLTTDLLPLWTPSRPKHFKNTCREGKSLQNTFGTCLYIFLDFLSCCYPSVPPGQGQLKKLCWWALKGLVISGKQWKKCL